MEERQQILATEEVYGFLEQSNISAKNIKRLEVLESIDDPKFQRLRTLVLEIAQVQPRKRRRWKILRQKHSDLYGRIVDSALVDHLMDEPGFGQHPDDDVEFAYRSIPFADIWLENREP